MNTAEKVWKMTSLSDKTYIVALLGSEYRQVLDLINEKARTETSVKLDIEVLGRRARNSEYISLMESDLRRRGVDVVLSGDWYNISVTVSW